MQAFIRDLEDNNIHEKLQQAIDSDPQENYGRFIALFNDAKIMTCQGKGYDLINISIKDPNG